MGAVYVVEQLSTGKERALKIMLPQLVADAKARERFMQEARIGGQIKGDHVVQVVGAGIDDATQTPWLAMELLDGEDLAALMRRRGALPPNEVLEIVEQLCNALGQAHALGIVHRDLKPENLFVEVSRRRGVPFTIKVLDFGIAKLVQENKTAATVTSAIGSPFWMAPEQAQRGAKVRPATDVWALGLITFYLLTGRNYWLNANGPIEEFNLSALLVEVMTEPIERASSRAIALGVRGALWTGFDDWFARCVDRSPAARMPNANEAFAALLQVLPRQRGAMVPPTAPMLEATLPSLPPVMVPVAASLGTVSNPAVRVVRSDDRPSGRWALAVALGGAGLVASLVVAIGWTASNRSSSAVPVPAMGTPPVSRPAVGAPPPVITEPLIARTVAAGPTVAIAPPAAPAPSPAAIAVAAPPPTTIGASRGEGATLMDQARACLRNNSSNMTVGNQCVVSVLRNRASTESERGLLCVTYRTMGQTSNAVRCMRQYIQAEPDGPRVPNFQQYIDNNSY